ncbi:MAG: hypothetical protein WC584_04810 [Candidatus Pacearchaeota archaeon]
MNTKYSLNNYFIQGGLKYAHEGNLSGLRMELKNLRAEQRTLSLPFSQSIKRRLFGIYRQEGLYKEIERELAQAKDVIDRPHIFSDNYIYIHLINARNLSQVLNDLERPEVITRIRGLQSRYISEIKPAFDKNWIKAGYEPREFAVV